jgi:hypothetical protein
VPKTTCLDGSGCSVDKYAMKSWSDETCGKIARFPNEAINVSSRSFGSGSV